MSHSLEQEIILVLNNDTSLENKRILLQQISKNRRGTNRVLLSVIIQILSKNILPLHYSKSLEDMIYVDLSEPIYTKLNKILGKAQCQYFNAICSELLWNHNHNTAMAKKAVESYLKEIETPTHNDKYGYVRMSLGICRIYSKYKLPFFDYEIFLRKALLYVEKNLDEDNYAVLFLLKALSAINKHVDLLANTYKKAICYYETNNMHEKANEFLEDLEQLLKNTDNKHEISQLKEKIATNYEKATDKYDWDDPSSSFKIIALIHKAMAAWDRTNNAKSKTERNRLAKRIEPVKKLSIKNLVSFKGPSIDIREWIDHIKEFIDASSFEMVLYRLCNIIKLKNQKETYNKHKSEDFSFSSMFGEKVLDQNGRTKCIIPSALTTCEDEICAIIEHEIYKEYNLAADLFIKRYLWIAKESFDFSEENLAFLVEDNAFIPSDRKTTILKGLIAGFNLDLSTAMHLLMPQLENCVRCLAQECGAIVYKTEKNGIESCLSFESILKLPEVIECFEETFLFNLRLFYTSPYAFGMRNNVCHGLYSDDELQSSESLAVWWFTLKICCMFSKNLDERLLSQTNGLKAKDKT